MYEWMLLTVLLPSLLACPGPGIMWLCIHMPVLFFLFYFFAPSVCVFPSGPVVTIPGRNQSFTCFLRSAESNSLQNISWMFNGSAVENHWLDSVIIEFKHRARGRGTLTFTNVSLEYNHTIIQCQATLQSNVIQSASVGVLLLQGKNIVMMQGE